MIDYMKLQAFAELVQKEQIEKLIEDSLDCEANKRDAQTKIKLGPKYTKVDIGRSGRFMVVNDTGEIFGIKAYGQVHKGHAYGTLDTTAEWYWGDYYPKRRPV